MLATLSSTSDTPSRTTGAGQASGAEETVLDAARYGIEAEGYTAMKTYAGPWPDRVWAIEGCNGARRHRRRPAPIVRCLSTQCSTAG